MFPDMPATSTINVVFFDFFAALTVISAVLMVTRRNVVHSAIFLITALLGTAGIFLQLEAEFLFAVQIILYVGGIMVLFLFVIMLVNLDVSLQQLQFNRQKWVAGVLAVALGAEFLLAFRKGGSLVRFAAPGAGMMQPNTELVGEAIFRNYMLPFELASILLLVAMIGAVVLAKRKI
jgi:NADH-quinone oxidoreductase subunit J